MKEIDAPTGYIDTSIALYQSYEATDMNSSIDFLNKVIISEDDFQWLNDIITIAKAYIYNRYNETELENEHINSFLKNQPTLLEPEHLISFGLLHYQETIKNKANFI